MTLKKENELLKKCLKDIIWMAVRYAHGRHTYAPSMVRDTMNTLKKLCPDYRYRDITIEPPTHKLKGVDFRSDYLDDLLDKGE